MIVMQEELDQVLAADTVAMTENEEQWIEEKRSLNATSGGR